jgi:hypothetical protein
VMSREGEPIHLLHLIENGPGITTTLSMIVFIMLTLELEELSVNVCVWSVSLRYCLPETEQQKVIITFSFFQIPFL